MNGVVANPDFDARVDREAPFLVFDRPRTNIHAQAGWNFGEVQVSGVGENARQNLVLNQLTDVRQDLEMARPVSLIAVRIAASPGSSEN